MDESAAPISSQREPGQKLVVIGVIGSDVHIIGITVIGHALREAGYAVVSLGVCVPQSEFIEAAVETAADAILVSSVYGQGEIDCRGLPEACAEAGLDIPVLVGGNLVVGRRDWAEVERTFLDMGYTKVYPPGSRPEGLIDDLAELLGSARA